MIYNFRVSETDHIWFKLNSKTVSKIEDENNFQIQEIDFQNGADEDDA